ncbi:hypothetical protein A2422_03245 [Candidatus Woesebacteria bacterium RIFOXYC1_FULL_31_51]|uniref:Type II secretion system protein GspG C-terminal domain-containing protein n=1 Tax=Candidatus Woesebacteria bacterium GW2011_GWC2_31_9 TaxID=1618586 RepID=A0A0F9Z0C9_9BACT|nr:MAG: hypothetical protein UR17_C0001G0154 [Candidatus Woesebacteria bacterium GW2011_GWF1_31_35]KKP23349.1 MAG: hypothetical protein UR11_C0001G0323 [Candidatus Woesebacteria bacterium GW2011_GWC1_30_29]KKP26134.1 MAG: hypothetical protein UR13_C0005G0017 [Candidatus Woesebacteria bacterium GW2011_GWD1_31_12]KKP27609.1 MAG: hypothetical protein UR16_C0003G0269 [Candidatus Woesebacteria bacterium GW2011_GWB1_31_29]KKP32126.1 MAG: hypothetical protein UR21_C0002G0045 [Candidatus Woesebacteria 
MNERVKTIITIFFILFLYPVGLILVWFWVDWSKWIKWLITIPLVLALLGVVMVVILSTRSPNKALQQAKEKSGQAMNYFGNTNEALDKQIRYDISSTRSALELYKVDYQKYPISLNNLVPKYISEVKINPYTKQSYQYSIGIDGKYTISTTLTDGSLYFQTSP